MDELEIWLTWIKLAVSLGAVTALAAGCKYAWNRYRWRHFKNWLWLSKQSVVDHPKEMTDDDWKVLTESILIDARFSPFEIHQLLDLAVVTARGIIASRLL